MGWSRGYHGYVFEDPRDGASIGPEKYSGRIDSMYVPMHYIKLMEDREFPLAALTNKKGENKLMPVSDSNWIVNMKVVHSRAFHTQGTLCSVPTTWETNGSTDLCWRTSSRKKTTLPLSMGVVHVLQKKVMDSKEKAVIHTGSF